MGPKIRRVLFAVDSAAQSRLLGEAAMRLAVDQGARLHAMFVEDLNLLRASALPFVHEISLPAAELRPFTEESIERALRTTAENVRGLLAEIAARLNVEWTFDVRREHFPGALVASLETADLLLIAPRPALSEGRLKKSRLDPATRVSPIIALVDRQESAPQVLQAAFAAQTIFGSRLIVSILAENHRQFEKARQEVAGLLESARAPTFVEPAAVQTVSDLLGVARRQHASLLFLGADSPLIQQESLRILVNRLECLIGIVR